MEIVLDSFGARLRQKDGMFLIELPDLQGVDHKCESFPAHQVSTIIMNQQTSLSTNAIAYALENDTDIIVLDKMSMPIGRFTPVKPNTTLNVWKAQMGLSGTTTALVFAKDWIMQKIRFKLEFFQKLKSYRKGEKLAKIQIAEKAISDILSRLHAHPIHAEDIEKTEASIRGYEGSANRIYWGLLSSLLPEEYQFDGRSRLPADDQFNVFLNYSYGILYRHVESALVRAGVNPYIGFFHTDTYMRKSMVFDFIEQYRVWVDNLVFKAFSAKQVTKNHSTLLQNGGHWLNKEGIRLIGALFAEKSTEKRYPYTDGNSYDFASLIQVQAKALAATLNKIYIDKQKPTNVYATVAILN
jgi:CRISP-associated protein Cas1